MIALQLIGAADPISYFQAVVLGALQGFSELFPISSLGHSVIAPRLLGWDIHQNDSFFITFLVATHLATALVLLSFFCAEAGATPSPSSARSRVRPAWRCSSAKHSRPATSSSSAAPT